jgi:hypothetical protein
MYVSTYSGLTQVPTLHGSFSGTLGASPFPPEIQEFLNQVRKRPHDFKKILLTVTFHPTPTSSMSFVKQQFNFGKQTKNLVDELLMSSTPAQAILDPLRRIRHKFRTQDAGFRRQIEAELQIRNEMIKTAGDSATRLLLQKKLQPMLVEASLTEDFSLVLCKLGLSSAQKLLPAALVQRIRNSEVSEAHLTNLGKFFRRYGEVLQGKDPAFKATVEQEIKRRQQEKQEQERRAREEEERKKKQQRRRRP